MQVEFEIEHGSTSSISGNQTTSNLSDFKKKHKVKYYKRVQLFKKI